MTFRLAAQADGGYAVDGGRFVTARVDMPENGETEISVRPK